MDGRQVPAEVLNLAVKGRALVLLWQLQQQHEDEDLEIEGWPQSVARFFNVLQGLLPQEPLKATVATAMADLYLVFRAEPLQVGFFRIFRCQLIQTAPLQVVFCIFVCHLFQAVPSSNAQSKI